MTTKGTTRRSFRAGDVWDQALIWAEQRGETLTDVLISALVEYIEGSELDARLYDMEERRREAYEAKVAAHIERIESPMKSTGSAVIPIKGRNGK